MTRVVLLLMFVLVMVTGCMTTPVPEVRQEAEVAVLAKNLCALSPRVDAKEARQAANVSIRYPLQLAGEWRVTPPAVFNNVLINWNIHPRGLCYQWADDLTAKLITLHLQTLELHRGIAYQYQLREHSSVVLTAPDQAFTNGIVLDAWRDCGRLHWAAVTTDKYPWKEISLNQSRQKDIDAAVKKLESASK